MTTQDGVVHHRVKLTPAHTRADREQRGIIIAQSLRASGASFPGLAPTPDELDKLNADVKARKADVKNKVAGAGTAYKSALRALDDGLDSARGCVQRQCNLVPTQAATLAGSASMLLQAAPARPKPKDLADQGPTSGTAVGHVPHPPPRFAAEWEVSADGGVSWPIRRVTDMADITFKDLTPGVNYAFRMRLTVRGETGDFGQTFRRVIKCSTGERRSPAGADEDAPGLRVGGVRVPCRGLARPRYAPTRSGLSTSSSCFLRA